MPGSSATGIELSNRHGTVSDSETQTRPKVGECWEGLGRDRLCGGEEEVVLSNLVLAFRKTLFTTFNTSISTFKHVELKTWFLLMSLVYSNK